MEGPYYSPWTMEEYITRLINVNPFEYDSIRTREFFQTGIEQGFSDGKVPVLSQESMSGNPRRRGYASKEVADRLKDTFPEARILLVIREQISWLLSFYKYHVREGQRAGLKRYYARNEASSTLAPRFQLGFIDYRHLIGYYQGLFGPERMLVLPLEQLAESGDGFAKSINRFCGISDDTRLGALGPQVANPGVAGFMVHLHRLSNILLRVDPGFHDSQRRRRLARRLTGPLYRLVPEKLNKKCDEVFRRQIVEIVGDYYDEGNRVTEKLTGLDLLRCGYRVSRR